MLRNVRKSGTDLEVDCVVDLEGDKISMKHGDSNSIPPGNGELYRIHQIESTKTTMQQQQRQCNNNATTMQQQWRVKVAVFE